MKMFVGLLSLALSFVSIASSGETKTFTYDGTQNSIELLLKGEKTHTEYRYEQRTTTCYRTDMVGYRTVCSTNGGGYPGPRPGPGYPGPRPGPRPGGQNCYQQPIYRQVAYACTQTIQIPFEVKDYDVDARVIVDVANMTGVTTLGEKFVVTLQGDDLSITTVGSKKFFLVLSKQSNRGSMNGSVKFIDALYAVELVEAAPVLKALTMTNISIENSILSFIMGPVADRANIGFSLNVTHKKILASDVVLFDRELDASEVILKAGNAGTVADVNIQQLGVILNSGKYALTAKAFFKAAGSIMNESQFGDTLVASRTLLYKIR
jgi:hypothetical protein